jgi:hypothetical protein
MELYFGMQCLLEEKYNGYDRKIDQVKSDRARRPDSSQYLPRIDLVSRLCGINKVTPVRSPRLVEVCVVASEEQVFSDTGNVVDKILHILIAHRRDRVDHDALLGPAVWRSRYIGASALPGIIVVLEHDNNVHVVIVVSVIWYCAWVSDNLDMILASDSNKSKWYNLVHTVLSPKRPSAPLTVELMFFMYSTAESEYS